MVTLWCLLALAAWQVFRLGTGRPNAVALSLVVVPLAILGVREANDRHLQQQLSAAATVLAGQPVRVECQTLSGSWVDGSSWLGHVDYSADGRPDGIVHLAHATCNRLDDWLDGDRGAGSEEQVVAVHVLAHEAEHAAGERSEAIAECRSLQRTTEAARLLGAVTEQAEQVAAAYARDVYPRMGDDYRSADCRNGAPLDLRPDDPSWP